jgi:pimeloyl-ACP methyl ester carboxylesterase
MAALFLALASAAADDTGPAGGLLRVPLDHDQPGGPAIELYYESGAPFDRTLPTVLVVGDGQQFYLRRGALRDLQNDLFGPGLNVVGLVGRGSDAAVAPYALGPDGRPDWEKAWRLFRSAQWIEDLETLRARLVGKKGRVLLFGQSGGALLVREYLARHGDRVSRAVTVVPPDPFLVGEFRLATDRFWEEIGAASPDGQERMRQVMTRYASDRITLALTLQRQNFFVPPDQIQAERRRLITALAAGDTDAYATARTTYQVEEVKNLLDLPDGVPARVREYELFQPSGGQERLRDVAFHPDLEVQSAFAAPLLDLLREGRIPPPALDRRKFAHLEADVLVIAGRWDHTVDYRIAMAEATGYLNGRLFLADGDHMLARLKEGGTLRGLVGGFLRGGPGGSEFRAAEAAAEPKRFVEH